MAFNPFEAFSIRSKLGKSVMAVLGIVVMLTFVLSSGAVGSGMDFFDQLGDLFGTRRGKGDVIATAYGEDIRSSELEDVRRQRAAAREYLSRAVAESYMKWARDLDADVKAGRLSADVKDVVGRFVALRLKSDTEPRAYQGYLGQFTGQFGGQMQDLFKFLEAWRKGQAKADSDDKRAMDAMVAIMVHDVGLSPLYLAPPLNNENDRDLLDFIVLLRKADKLGIHFSTDGIKDLVQRDTGGRLTEEDYRKIETTMRHGPRTGSVSTEWLAQSIANEYRARVALLAVEGKPLFPELVRAQRDQIFQFLGRLGVDLGSVRLPGEPSTETAIPGGMTPYEFYEFFKDRCSENSFQVLELDARAYVDQVAEKPTKAELNALFAKHRGELPDPSRERPGFKEPKKVKIEFVAVDATSPRITQAVPKMEAAGAFLQATTGVFTGDPMAALINAARPDAAAGSPLAPIDLVARVKARAQVAAAQEPYSIMERFDFTPRDSSIYRAQPIISALGMLSGQPDIAAVTGALATVHQHVERLDHQARLPLLIQPVLTPFNPTLANALGMPSLALVHTPKPPAETLYMAVAVTAAKKDQQRNLFMSDVSRLRDKLRTLSGGDDPLAGIPNMPKPDKAKMEKGREEAKQYLIDWLKDRGLTPKGNKAPLDQWTMTGDPELKPLIDLAKPDPDGSNDLSRKVFADQQNRFMDEVKPFTPFWFPSDPIGESLSKPNHLVWLTEETPAVAYNNLDNADRITKGEMSKKVEAAWKLEKARALAKADADKIVAKVKEIVAATPNNRDAIERQLRDVAAEKKLRDFSLERMALLKFEHGLNPNQQGYRPPTIEKTQVLYPTPDFVDKLLELRKEPIGAVTALPDSPRTHFYVACLVAKNEKTVEQFRNVFDRSNATGLGRDPLYAQYALPEARGQAIRDARLRLEADAKLDIKEAFTKRERREDE